MARRCTTVPGYGFCCNAAQQNALNRPVRMTTSGGKQRCVQCTTITRTKNRGQGFQFRFVKNAQCGIGPSGCPVLGQGAIGNAGNTTQIPVITQ